jgi:signal transduction histidine kinase
LMQALVNLVINALQAVERKGRIQVSAGRFENSLSLQVRDNGPGIPAEKLVSIFEPYFTTKPEGTGMGLWIAQQIATAHGGSLRVQNAPERGAVFTLLLPLKQVTP